jgi:hypothetical protein
MFLLSYNKDVVYEITASKNCVVDFQMIGGGGGAGGADSHPGSPGYNGLIASGSIPLSANETVYCALGGPGYGGNTGQGSAAGGAGGYAINNYSGGSGGNAGPSGTSGGGGGGGGASLIWKNSAYGYQTVSNILAVSPGGPGGGGGGNYSDGYGNASVSALIVPRGYYPSAEYNGAYCEFLNTYGIWNGDGDYTYEVYFPFASQGRYTFELSADNYAAIYVNNYLVVETQGGEGGEAAYQNVWTGTYDSEPGWKTVRISAQNWGGPASVAAAINTGFVAGPQNRFWTTRESYNPLSYNDLIGRGGHGQDHRGDGGGAGGGGGGYIGGTGGTGPSGDNGAMSGNYGTSFLSTSVASSDNTLLADGGGSGFGLGGLGGYGANGIGGAVVFNSTQTDIKYNSSGNLINVKEVYVRNSSQWTKVQEVYVRDSSSWKRVYGDNIPNVTSSAVTYNNISGVMTPYSPEAATGGVNDGCKIICTKLHELGYLPDYIYEADEKFGQYLRDNDPYAYYGYVKWASVVVDWIEKDGPQCMFWIRDKEKRGEAQRKMAIAWARRIATPWAHHMAYLMGAEKTDNKAGRLIMNTGMFISRMIGKYTKTKEPTKNVALGYLMWVTFGVFWLLAGVK